ncbi:MAG TPA: hypothetical protein VNQ77_13985 [Frankiaceae bacterium]|nr:hypothetical protein [Frankiaceae bacterium]
MRRIPALAVSLVLATAAAAGAAPARGVTFTDPAGDADAVDGRAGATSQARFDVVRVRLAPHARTAKSSGVAIRIDLASAPSTSPGSSYFFTAKQGACDITVSRTATTDGIANSTLVMCGPVVGEYHSTSVAKGLSPTGTSISFTVPADALPNPALGAQLTAIEVGTSAGEPVSGYASPARIDRAAYAKAYRLGS